MYYPQTYKNINLKTIKEDAKKQGFKVSLVKDEPNFVYKPHNHPETKYLVFISGIMKVFVGKEIYMCKPGDKLVIKGNTTHSALVGKEGCTFFWSERVLNSKNLSGNS